MNKTVKTRQCCYILLFNLHWILPVLDKNLPCFSWIVTIMSHRSHTFTQTRDINRKQQEDVPTLPAPTFIPLTDNEQHLKYLKGCLYYTYVTYDTVLITVGNLSSLYSFPQTKSCLIGKMSGLQVIWERTIDHDTCSALFTIYEPVVPSVGKIIKDIYK